MNYQEQKQTLFDAIQLLMQLYQDVSARAEPLTPTRDCEKKTIQIASF